MKVEQDMVVDLAYALHLGDGEVIDRSGADEPMSYLHGRGQIVPGLEEALAGMAVGESKQVVVAPEQGYGSYNPDALREVEKSMFPSERPLEAGMQFLATAPNGEKTPITVQEVRGDAVVIDFNHPLAGKSLHFEVTIKDVRKATAEEIQHGHAHSGDGHAH